MSEEKQEENNKRIANLRQQAEQVLSSRSADGAGNDQETKELKRLLYELQVYQVELEMQNENLLHSRMEIEDAKNEYTDLYDYAPVHYFTLDNHGLIVKLNLLAAKLLGFDRRFLIQTPWLSFVVPAYKEVFLAFFKSLTETGSRQVCEIEITDANKQTRIVQLQGLYAASNKNNRGHYLLTLTDLTELKKAEAAKAYADQFKQMIAGMPDMYLFLSPDYRVLEVSDHFLQTLHRQRHEVIDHTLFEVFTYQNTGLNIVHDLRQSLQEVILHQKAHQMEVQQFDIVLPDGAQKKQYWRISHSPVFEPGGEVRYIIEHITDVTREYAAEQEVEKNRQRFEQLALASNDIVWEWDIPSGQWWWNRNLEAQFGYQRTAIEAGMEAWANRIHPEEKEQVVAVLMRTLLSGQKEWKNQYRFRRANGSYAYVLDRGFTIQDTQGKTIQMVGTMVDLTELKEAELALKESHQRFALLLETIPHKAWITGPDGHNHFYNRQWFTYTGTSPDTLKDTSWRAFIHPEDLALTLNSWLQALQSASPLEIQSRWKRADDGEYRWHIVQVLPVHNHQGQLTQWVGTLTDIHEHKLHEEFLEKRVNERTAELSSANQQLKEEIAWRTQLEERLRENQLLTTQIVEATPDIVHVYDLIEQKTLYLNHAITSILGYTLEEIQEMGTSIFDKLIHPADQARCKQAIAYLATLATSEAREMEYRLKDKSGNWHWVWVRYAVFRRNIAGMPIQIIGIVHDITEKKKNEEILKQSQRKLKQLNEKLEERVARRTRRLEETFKQLQHEFKGRIHIQEALQQNQERFQYALEKSPVILFTQDTQLTFTWIHNKFHFIGNQDVTGKKDTDILPAKAADTLMAIKKLVLQLGEGVREEICLEIDGNNYYYDLTVEPLWATGKQITGVACAAVDITETRLARAELARSEQRYRILTESIPEMIFTLDVQGQLNYANSWMSQFTGLSSEELASKGWWQVLHPDDRQQLQATMAGALQSQETYLIEVRFRRAADNEYIWHLKRIMPFKDLDGKVVKWIGISTDIHGQKLVEVALRDNAELREAQQKLRIQRDFSRSLIDNSIDGIFTFDTVPRYTSWNPVVEDIYQTSREEVLGKNIFELFPAYRQTDEGKAILRVLQGEKVTLYNQPYEHKSGYYEINLIPLFNESKEVIGGLGILHDVTERIRLEEERTSYKLKRQKILLNAILEAQEGERRRIAEALHNGLAQTLYAAKLNLEQLSLAGADTKELKESRNRANSLLADAIRETRNISHELIPTILEDFGLKGAINDICKKYAQSHMAIQAEIYGIEERLDKYLEIGIYRIAQELVNNAVKHAEASRLHIHLVKGERGILLKVSDNGKGFDASGLAPAPKGIGLKTIQDRIKLLNGSMDINSKPGEGTQVSIIIPG